MAVTVVLSARHFMLCTEVCVEIMGMTDEKTSEMDSVALHLESETAKCSNLVLFFSCIYVEN